MGTPHRASTSIWALIVIVMGGLLSCHSEANFAVIDRYLLIQIRYTYVFS